MDPSHSVSSDPHHPPQYAPFPQFTTSSSPFVPSHASAPNHPFFGGQSVNQNPFNSHVFPPQPQPQPLRQTPPSQAATLPPPPSSNHPPYSELICGAIAALNEPDGSSKMAISRYIERSQPVLPTAHAALLTHHLKSLKSSGVLVMVKKSYKLAASSLPDNVSVVAAPAAAGLVAPRSEIPPSNTSPLDLVAVSASGSASQPQKRGRGRPPKPKPEAPQQQQPINVQPDAFQSNGLPSWEQPELPETNPTQVVTESAKRGPGRPRKDGAAPIVPAAGMAVVMKRRGRPPGRRAAGRQRKPTSVSATASVFPYVANGARRRGRPRRVDSGGVDSGGVATVAPAGGETVAVAPGMKRGRGRPRKIGGVMNRLITKPKRGRGRPVGRSRKITTWPVTEATGISDAVAYGELKGKLDFFLVKAKEILNILKVGNTSGDNQAVPEAIHILEGLIPILTAEPHAMEEVQSEETSPQTEAVTQEGEHGQERGGGEQAQTQTEAEAMQEALF